MDNILARLSVAQLKKVTAIKERIEALEAKLTEVIGGSDGAVTAAPTDGRRRRRKMSAEAREKIAAAQRARWARVKAKK